MKILKITLLNINSLKGQHSIDFRDEKFSKGLFAITGATGAGKTTILDAICVAMYAKTPRLSNPNELMSKYSGECFCEVEFEINGIEYRSRWSQRRARKKFDGKFQIAQMELSLLENGKIIESKLQEVPKKVEEIIHLDFKRFTKSIMLAQGSFDAFLKSNPNERAHLLEKITGMEIYTQISQKVFERKKIELEKFESLKKELGSIKLLSSTDIIQINIQIEQRKEQRESLKQRVHKLHEKINWLKNIEELKELVCKQKDNISILKESQKKQKPQFDKLSLAKKAKRHELSFLRFQDRVIQKDKLAKEINKIQKEINKREENEKKELEQIEKQKNKQKLFLSSYQDKLESIQQALIIENQLIEIEKKYKEQLKKSIATNQKINTLEKELISLNKEIEINTKKEKQYISSLKRQIRDENIQLELLVDIKKTLKQGMSCPLCNSTIINDIEKESNHNPNLKDIKKYISTKEKLEKIQTKLIPLKLDKMEKDTHLNINKRAIKANSLEIVCMETKIEKLKNSIKHLLKNQTPKAYQQTLDKEKNQLEKELINLKDNFQKQQSQYIANKKLISLETKNLEHLKREINGLQENLLKEIKEDNFSTIEELQNAYLEKSIFDQLSKKEENLLQKIKQNQILLLENSQKLNYQINNPLTEYSLEILLKERKAYEESIESISKEIGNRENQLKEDLKNKNRQSSLISKLENQERELYKWSKLNDLIGSKDGDKFRKFAQHLTLGHLTQLANQYLEKISQRYLIKNSDKKELEIEIIDTYQANIIRSTNTLSGGEKFLVSLSLALGLSDLVSKNISIKSLFLDEGFDTLDEDTLDIALNALDYLQHQGKMIGIISHVEILKERIPNQIHIQKLNGGFSKLIKI